MLGRLLESRQQLAELARRPIPGPVDMLNLISLRSNRAYKWYGLSALPVLSAVGGRVKWLGYRADSLHGTPQADKLIIVRFPSHKRFLAMVANPYFRAVNRIREAAVEYFELSFTYAHVQAGKLADCDIVVGVHYNPATAGLAHDAIGRVVAPGPGRLVYASSEQSAVGLVGDPDGDPYGSHDDLHNGGHAHRARPLKGSDPHPLSLKRLALIAYDSVDQARRDVESRLAGLQDLAAELSVQLYRRGSMRRELPWARSRAPSQRSTD